MTVLKFELPAEELRNRSEKVTTESTEEGAGEVRLAVENPADVVSLLERFPEAFEMEKAVIQRKVTDALSSIAEHKAAHLARFFGLDGEAPEQTIDEAAAGRAVLDAFQEAAPDTSSPANIELLRNLHDIAGKIVSATDVDPDALRALRKPPKKKGPRTDLIDQAELKELQEADCA